MGGLIAGIVAIVVGGTLGVATTIGIVNTVQDSPDSSDASVVDYGSS